MTDYLSHGDYSDLEKQHVDHDRRLILNFLGGCFPSGFHLTCPSPQQPSSLYIDVPGVFGVEYNGYRKDVGFCYGKGDYNSLFIKDATFEGDKQLHTFLMDHLRVCGYERIWYMTETGEKVVLSVKDGWFAKTFRQIITNFDPINEITPYNAQECYDTPRVIEYLITVLIKDKRTYSKERAILNIILTALKRLEQEPHFYTNVMIPYQQKLLQEKADQHQVKVLE